MYSTSHPIFPTSLPNFLMTAETGQYGPRLHRRHHPVQTVHAIKAWMDQATMWNLNFEFSNCRATSLVSLFEIWIRILCARTWMSMPGRLASCVFLPLLGWVLLDDGLALLCSCKSSHLIEIFSEIELARINRNVPSGYFNHPYQRWDRMSGRIPLAGFNSQESNNERECKPLFSLLNVQWKKIQNFLM